MLGLQSVARRRRDQQRAPARGELVVQRPGGRDLGVVGPDETAPVGQDLSGGGQLRHRGDHAVDVLGPATAEPGQGEEALELVGVAAPGAAPADLDRVPVVQRADPRDQRRRPLDKELQAGRVGVPGPRGATPSGRTGVDHAVDVEQPHRPFHAVIITTAGQRPIAPIGENESVSTDTLGLLLPGESIVWSGEPIRHRILRGEDVLLIPFSRFWGGFAIFWEASALQVARSDPAFVLIGLLPVLVGLYLIFGRFIVRAVASHRARYLVTDGRVVVTGGVTGRAVGTAYLAALPPPVVTETEDGTGDLAFGSFPGFFGGFGGRVRGASAFGYEPIMPPRFRDIPDVLRVRDLIVTRQDMARRI